MARIDDDCPLYVVGLERISPSRCKVKATANSCWLMGLDVPESRTNPCSVTVERRAGRACLGQFHVVRHSTNRYLGLHHNNKPLYLGFCSGHVGWNAGTQFHTPQASPQRFASVGQGDCSSFGWIGRRALFFSIGWPRPVAGSLFSAQCCTAWDTIHIP